MSAEDLAAKGIALPRSMFVEREPRYVCNVPGCDYEFYEGEERQRVAHAKWHARVHEAELMEAASASPTGDILGEGDPERQSWLRRRYAQIRSLNPRDY